MLRFLGQFQADFQLKSGWIEPLLVGGHAPFSPPRTGKSQGHSDGRLVRNTERALRHAQDQGQEEENRDTVHLLRHPHSERSPPGGASGRAARDQGGIRDSETELRWSPPKRTPNLVIGKVSKFTTLECRYTSKKQLKLVAWNIKIPR